MVFLFLKIYLRAKVSDAIIISYAKFDISRGTLLILNRIPDVEMLKKLL